MCRERERAKERERERERDIKKGGVGRDKPTRKTSRQYRHGQISASPFSKKKIQRK
jgi:hypothetical protein